MTEKLASYSSSLVLWQYVDVPHQRDIFNRLVTRNSQELAFLLVAEEDHLTHLSAKFLQRHVRFVITVLRYDVFVRLCGLVDDLEDLSFMLLIASSDQGQLDSLWELDCGIC